MRPRWTLSAARTIGRRALLVPAVFFVGCSTSVDAPDGKPSGLAGGSGQGGNPAMGEGACAGEGDKTCLQTVQGQVQDEAGEPVEDLEVTVCGPTCFPGKTDAQGRFQVDVGQDVVLGEYSVQPHGTPSASTFYFLFPEDFAGGDYDTGVLHVLDLGPPGDSLVVKTDKQGAPAQTVTGGLLELSVDEGTFVRLSLRDVIAEGGDSFRARQVEASWIDELAPEMAGYTVFALGPFETAFQDEESSEPRTAELRVDNLWGLAPRDELEVQALGTYLDPDWLPPAQFAPVGTAVISDDGSQAVLDVDAEPGLRWITWIALKPLE